LLTDAFSMAMSAPHVSSRTGPSEWCSRFWSNSMPSEAMLLSNSQRCSCQRRGPLLVGADMDVPP